MCAFERELAMCVLDKSLALVPPRDYDYTRGYKYKSGSRRRRRTVGIGIRNSSRKVAQF